MNSPCSETAIAACILAAGTASRFGATKQTQEFCGKPLLQYAVEAAEEVCGQRVHVVLGHEQDAVRDAISLSDDCIVINPDYQDGIGSSIAVGIRESRQDADAVLLMLGDQPLVNADHLHSLVSQWSGATTEIVASRSNDIICPPILFPNDAFDDLAELSGDTGAKHLLTSPRFSLRTVDIPAAAEDIDTPDDLARLSQLEEEKKTD